MLASLLLASLVSVPSQLRANESHSYVGVHPEGRVVALGRVLDAFDGRPIAGATVELWTEDDEQAAVRTHLVATEHDGSFLVRATEDTLVGEKWVVHAPDHTSAAGALDEELEVFLLPRREGRRMRMRFVDVAGGPIEGAKVATRYPGPLGRGMGSLKKTETDAEGRFTLPNVMPGRVELRASRIQRTPWSACSPSRRLPASRWSRRPCDWRAAWTRAGPSRSCAGFMDTVEE